MQRPTRPPAPAAQEALERRAERLLQLLRRQPDSGLAQVAQMYAREPAPVQQTVVQKLMLHYATANTEQQERLAKKLEQLTQPPHQLGILDGIGKNGDGDPFAVVSTHEGLLEVSVCDGVSSEELVPGHRVAMARNGAIVAVRDLPEANPTAEFDRLLPDDRMLVRGGGEQPFVLRPAGELLDPEQRDAIKAGDLLEYDPGTLQALRVSHRSSKIRDFLGEVPDVEWSDVGGLEPVRAALEEEVLGPIAHPGLYAPYGTRPPRGVLLEGPPGVGKTLVVKALGRALLRTLELDDTAPVLFKVKGTALQSAYVGEGPARVRALARTARETAREFGLAIIMLDDFEYGGGLHRGVGDGSSPAYSALSASLIGEMDGLDGRDSTVLWAATVNRADLLDGALLRAGRFSKKICVPRPGPEATAQILMVHLRGIPLDGDRADSDLVEQVVQGLFSSADENLLMRVHFSDADHEEIFPSRVLSGALLAEAVRGATLRAIRRDREAGDASPGGVRCEDLERALDDQLDAAVRAITPKNAGLHFLGLPEDRRVVAVERFDRARIASEDSFLH